jgi:hypothetical protein
MSENKTPNKESTFSYLSLNPNVSFVVDPVNGTKEFKCTMSLVPLYIAVIFYFVFMWYFDLPIRY